MEERFEPVEGTYSGIEVRGVSVAGRETYFVFPRLGIAFDIGRAPREILPVNHVFLSHPHLDHAAGLAYWASQRKLLHLDGGCVYTEPSSVPIWREILALHEKLEGTHYSCSVEPLPPGQDVAVRRDLYVRSFPVPHRVAGLGFLVNEKRKRLLAPWRSRSEDEIRKAAASGVAVAEDVTIPLVAFSGDTSSGIFETAPADFFRARVLFLECSFLDPADTLRAHQWGHLHIAEIAKRASQFENEVIVLTHLSLRTRPSEVISEIRSELPRDLARKVVPFLPHTH